MLILKLSPKSKWINKKKDFKPNLINDKNSEISITNLDNGIKIITENSPFPSYTDIGILGNIGIRNEKSNTSGAANCMPAANS